MRGRILAMISTLFALSIIGIGATAQVLPPAEGMLEAKVVKVDASARTITVEFGENGETATYPVAEDAELFAVGAEVRSPIELSEIDVGSGVFIQGMQVGKR